MTYGMHHLQGAVDCHVHSCPHLNGRSVNVLESVRGAAAAGMRAIGLMDNFQNSSGYAALANEELRHLGVEVFGGLIMQPSAGGVSYAVARNAVDYGYGPGTGARFLSLPTHHTKGVAEREGRSPAYIETTFSVPASGKVPEPVPAIMELCSERDIVFDCGHVSGPEAVALAREAKVRGANRVRTHCNGYDEGVVGELASLGAHCEFSFFMITHAMQIGLTHVDQEKHRGQGMTIDEFVPKIRAAGGQAIISSDAGIYLLAPPVESFREYIVMLEAEGFTEAELRRMTTTNPIDLFRIGTFA